MINNDNDNDNKNKNALSSIQNFTSSDVDNHTTIPLEFFLISLI